jgi:hypothetical protein
MTNKFTIKFEVDVINPKEHTLSVGRKKGTSTLTTELDEDELQARLPDLSQSIAMDLTNRGTMLFNKPTIKSIKPFKERKPNGSGIRNLKKMFTP